MTTATQSQLSSPSGTASKPALFGWILFDWAAQPYFTLVTTFIFAPYFVNAMASDPVHGQALWGYAAALAGLLIAVLSPVFGSIADVTGKRKPWVFYISIIFVASMFVFWLAKPGSDAPIFLTLAAVVISTVCAELQIVFVNAMMPSLVPQSQLGRLSGTGWAAGYAGGLVSLILFAGFIATSPETGKTLLGLDPLISLNQETREADRLSGPFAALWFVVFALPFFLWTPDSKKTGPISATPVSDGLKDLKETFHSLRHYRNIALYLIARLLYIDGLSAIFVFGGIYGTAIFGWSAFEIGVFGIVASLAGAVGAAIGGPLDDRLGPKPVIVWSLLGLLIASIGILSIDKSHILFVTQVPEKLPDSTPFSTLGEQFYVLCGILIGLVAGPLQSASRTFLAHLAPKDKLTQFYGLYAFSGKVTSFMAPLLVAQTTAITGSQRWGIAPIALFLILGAILIIFVKDERTD